MSQEKCPHCGAVYEGAAKFCTSCGAPREEAVGETAQPAEAAASSEPEPIVEPEPEPVTEPEPEPTEEVPSVMEMAEDKERKKKEKEEADGVIKPKGSKKGCIIAIIIVLVLIVGVPLVIILANTILPNIGSRSDVAEVHDFDYMAEDDFDIWWKGPDGYVTNDNEMAKVHNALCGVKGSTDSDYAVEVTVFIQKVADDDAWAGPVLRVNPKGGDRYAFQLFPNKKLVRITEIDNKGNVKVYAEKEIGQITPGKPYLILAQTEGNDLFMALNDKPLLKASAISLIQGPVGLEARDCVAYFDDLTITEPQ